MAFLRMIFPAWIAGLHASLLLAILILFLNPSLPASILSLAGLLPMVLALSVPAAVAWPLGYRFLRLFARRPLRVRGITFKYLYGFASADLLLVSALYWVNSDLADVMVPPAAALRLRLASGLLTLAALAFLSAAAIPPLRRRPSVRGAFHLTALLLPAALLLLRSGEGEVSSPRYTAEPVHPSPPSSRTFILGIEGATLDQVLPLVAQGKLPWFSRLLQRGAHGRLSPLRPTIAASLWESLWTGDLPYKHQILDSDRYRLPAGDGEIRLLPRGFGFRRLAEPCGMTRRRQSPAESRSMTFSEILERLGHPVEVIAEASPPIPGRDPSLPDTRLERFLDPEAPVPPGTEPLPVSLRLALEDDQAAAAAALGAWRGGRVRTVILVLHGLDRVSHLFLRYTMPAGFGDVPPEEEEKYGRVLEQYYRFLDEWIGKFVGAEEARDPGDDTAAFLVVSPHGIEPMPLARRFAQRLAGDRFSSGYHARGPDGMILAEGPGIRHGSPLGKASVLDLVPTLLYYYRLPVGKDMDGHTLTRLFQPAFTAENPILLIPSYEPARPAGSTLR
jgi:hypothetical protein